MASPRTPRRGIVPTSVMQSISRWVEDNGVDELVSQRDIKMNVAGKAATITRRIALLVRNGYLEATRQGTRLVRPYREGDPLEAVEDDTEAAI